jgi:spore coat protein CotF
MTLSSKKITNSIYDSCGNVKGFYDTSNSDYSKIYYSKNNVEKQNMNNIYSSSKSINQISKNSNLRTG